MSPACRFPQGLDGPTPCFHCKAAPLCVGELESATVERLLQDSILFKEIVDDVLLVPIEPTSQSGQKKTERVDGAAHGKSG